MSLPTLKSPQGLSLKIVFAFTLIALQANLAHAQQIEQINNKRAIINRDGMNFKIQQTWEVLGDKGEKTGEVVILKQQEEQVTGQITTGVAKQGSFLRLKTDVTEKERSRRLFAGLSILQSSFDVTVSGSPAGLSGGQFGLQAGVDQILTPRQILRLRTGLDLVNTKGTIANPPGCNGISDCTLWVHYLTGSLGFLFQVMPEGSKWNLGLNTGFVALIPISKSSTAIDDSKISADGGLELGGVLDFKINPITFVEISAQRMFLRTTDALRSQYNRYNLAWVQYF